MLTILIILFVINNIILIILDLIIGPLWYHMITIPKKESLMYIQFISELYPKWFLKLSFNFYYDNVNGIFDPYWKCSFLKDIIHYGILKGISPYVIIEEIFKQYTIIIDYNFILNHIEESLNDNSIVEFHKEYIKYLNKNIC